MNCDLWRSHFCSLDLSLLFIVFVGCNFVSGIGKLKPKKTIKGFLNLGFSALIMCNVDNFSAFRTRQWFV